MAPPKSRLLSTIHPSKRLGQHFLVDPRALAKLVAAAELQPEDTVLEIGPGRGALTRELAKRAKKVLAVEKDAKMVAILQKTLTGFQNTEVIHADILQQDTPYGIPHTAYKVVANLPYYITAPVIRKFLESSKAKPYSMTLIVQKEVAQRICAKPPNMSILAVSVQIYAMAKIIAYVKKSSFWPQPKVDSAILHITPHAQPYPLDFPRFFAVVKAGFSHPRKQLLNNLSTGLRLPRSHTEQWLLQNNINPTLRAEALSVEDWINLANTV